MSEEPTVEEMLDALQAATETETDRSNLDTCPNCQIVTAKTDVVTKERGRGQLHYCGECDRLLTTDEYETWRATQER